MSGWVDEVEWSSRDNNFITCFIVVDADRGFRWLETPPSASAATFSSCSMELFDKISLSLFGLLLLTL